jgi:hypothetical protein
MVRNLEPWLFSQVLSSLFCSVLQKKYNPYPTLKLGKLKNVASVQNIPVGMDQGLSFSSEVPYTVRMVISDGFEHFLKCKWPSTL